jgi:hypothetical protein
MHRSLRALTCIALLSVAIAAPARPKLAQLGDQLKSSEDFRLRVQAALDLGASHDERALPFLVGALDDRNASVRAASAAALGKLGDARGAVALERHASDPSDSVREEVRTALMRLKPVETQSESHRILVKLAGVRNSTRVKSPAIEREVWSESRKKLDEMPGVHVVVSDASTSDAAAAPLVMLTPSVQKLAAARDGDSIVYSASVEYIVHTMPDEAIMARLSGTASAAATEREAQDKVAIAVLRREVLTAAIQSALSRAPKALVAAARL